MGGRHAVATKVLYQHFGHFIYFAAGGLPFLRVIATMIAQAMAPIAVIIKTMPSGVMMVEPLTR